MAPDQPPFDVHLGGYERVGNGAWLATKIEMFQNGVRRQTEEYSDWKVDVPVDPAMFDRDEVVHRSALGEVGEVTIESLGAGFAAPVTAAAWPAANLLAATRLAADRRVSAGNSDRGRPTPASSLVPGGRILRPPTPPCPRPRIPAPGPKPRPTGLQSRDPFRLAHAAASHPA